MVITAEPLLAPSPYKPPPIEKTRPFETIPHGNLTRTAVGLMLDFRFNPDRPTVIDASGKPTKMAIDAHTESQNIRGTNYPAGLQGTHSWNENVRMTNPNQRESNSDKHKKPPTNTRLFRAQRPPEGKWPNLQPGEVLIMPGNQPDNVKLISVEPGNVLARWTRKGELVVYRRKMAEGIATKTTLSPSDMYYIQTWPDPAETLEALKILGLPSNTVQANQPSAQELNPAAINVSDGLSNPVPSNATVTPIETITVNAAEPPVNQPDTQKPELTTDITPDSQDLFDRLAESAVIDTIPISQPETQRLEQIRQTINKLTDLATRKMNRAIMETVRLRREWQSLPPWAKYAIRTATITLIPLIPLLLQTGSMPIPDVHAGPPIAGDIPHPPLGHADVAIGNLQHEPLPVIAEVTPSPIPPIQPESPIPPAIEIPPTANTPPVTIDNVCQVATEGLKASDAWPHPADWKPAENFQNDVFQPAANFNNAVFDKIASCGNEAFNPDGSLIWDKVKNVITEGEFNTFNNNLEHVARTTNLTGNPLDDSYVPKVSTPREPPGRDKD